MCAGPEQQTLTASDVEAGDFFGWSVDIDTTTVVVGSPQFRDCDIPEPLFCAPGAAYVYVETDGTWGDERKLTASDGVPGDEFGLDVAVHVDHIIVGAPKHNGGGAIKPVQPTRSPGTGWIGGNRRSSALPTSVRVTGSAEPSRSTASGRSAEPSTRTVPRPVQALHTFLRWPVTVMPTAMSTAVRSWTTRTLMRTGTCGSTAARPTFRPSPNGVWRSWRCSCFLPLRW